MMESPAAYLPQLHADSTVQLHQPGLQVHGLAVRVVEVDGCALVVVPLDLPQVHPQVIAELAELRFPRVLQAELESCKKESWKLKTFTNGHFVIVLNGIQICKSVHLKIFICSQKTSQTRYNLSHIMSK